MILADAYELSLFTHIIGAMVLLGALLLAATSLAPGRDGAAVRLGFRALLMAALPGYIVMRGAAQWVLDESGADEEEGWITIGFITSELGLLLMIIATVCAGLSSRRGGRPGLTRAAFFLSAFLVVMYVVTIWAMTTKPS